MSGPSHAMRARTHVMALHDAWHHPKHNHLFLGARACDGALTTPFVTHLLTQTSHTHAQILGFSAAERETMMNTMMRFGLSAEAGLAAALAQNPREVKGHRLHAVC